MRDKKISFWMKVAKLSAEMNCCASPRNVGCVIVSKDGRCLSMGWNGVPQGFEHPTVCIRKEMGIPSGEKLELCGCQHAESNALINAARNGVMINDAICFVTTSPCADCLGKLINAGIRQVYYGEEYSTINEVRALAEKGGVNLTLWRI